MPTRSIWFVRHVVGHPVVAGSVATAQQIHDLTEAGADAFTIGSAVFDGSFSPVKGSIVSQLRDVLDAAAT
jgi:tryptophan synthase alpha subunit